MGYLIPKSARNVKMQLFKGLGIVEAAMVIIAAVIGVLIFQTAWQMAVKIAVIAIVGIVTLFMVSPSFIVNKKGAKPIVTPQRQAQLEYFSKSEMSSLRYSS